MKLICISGGFGGGGGGGMGGGFDDDNMVCNVKIFDIPHNITLLSKKT